MSTTISITTGALSSSRTVANDTKARATLLAFYAAYNLGPADATAQQKLDAVLDYLVELIVRKARLQFVETARDGAITEAEGTYGFED
jgi:hypothetical protein